jgi:alpha-aminoadipate/glutamate carrier protein LysW
LLNPSFGGKEMKANCPECDAEITLDKPLRGEIIVCPDCGTELEVTSENPPVLDLAPQEEEDWGE